MSDPVSAAITIGLMAANMALTMTRKIEGPRLDDLKFTGGDYGVPLAMIWGLRRMQVPIFWAEDLREIKRRRKTKGGKYNEYTYYGTWAVALAGHEVTAIRRIWFDTHLVYDLTGAGPVTPFDFGASTGGSVSDYITFYNGSETQEPDPRMQATVEAEFGEGSCPAYRGTAYVIFKDIPLEKIGNRIPQVSVEIVNNPTNIYPFETRTSQTGLINPTFTPDRTLMFTMDSGAEAVEVWDVVARLPIAYFPIGGDLDSIAATGSTLYAISNTRLKTFSHSGSGPASNILTDYSVEEVIAIGGLAYLTSLSSATYAQYSNGSAITSVDVGFSPNFYCGDVNGGAWAIGRVGTTIHFYPLGVTGATPFSFTSPTASSSDTYAIDNGQGAFFCMQGGTSIFTVDKTGTVLATGTTSVAGGADNAFHGFRNTPAGSSRVWIGFTEHDTGTAQVVRTLDASDWNGTGVRHSVYDPINHAIIKRPSASSNITWNYLDRIGSDGITLETIANALANWCGVETYDFSDLDQTVVGWSATRGPASSMLEPLLDTYDSDILPHDFTIIGKKRTGVASGAVLYTEMFVGEPRYSVKVKTGLPRALVIDFADTTAEQQPNSVRSDRPLDATDARGEMKIDLGTLALDPDEARSLGDRYFRRMWNERKEYSLSLTAQNLGLEPGDVRTLSLDGAGIDARCTSVTIGADDIIKTQWAYESTSSAVLDDAPGAPFDGRNDQVVPVPVISKGFVLDIPLLTDSDDAVPPQVYPLAAPYAEGTWTGAIVYQSVDGEYSEELLGVPSSSATTWGNVEEAMPYANPNVWDRGTELTIVLQTGELTGCTEEAANSDPNLNLAAIGADGRWEIVQFTTATLTAPLTYTVSGFKRGRRGTEWAAELHTTADEFVLLENADAVAMGLSEVGTEVSFKAITSGRTTGFAIDYTYEGQSLKPYAPCHLEAVKEDNGDWTLTWVRRTRVGGAWTSGTTIPLSEASEEYAVTVGDGVSSDTKTVTSATTYTWTVATQITDTGGEVMAGDLDWSVAQVSDAVGAGFLAEAAA